MKKIISVLLALTMVLTTLSTCIVPASASELTSVQEYEIFYEKFEDYGEGNWLAGDSSVDSNNYITKNDTIGIGEKEWSVSGSVSTSKIEVVEDPKDPSNKVLHVTNSNAEYNTYDSFFNLRRNSNAKSGLATQDGKKLVMEVDAYVVNTAKSIKGVDGKYEGNFFTYSTAANASYSTTQGIYSTFSGTSFIPRTSGAYQKDYFARTSVSGCIGKWITLRYVVDVSESDTATHSDTSRAYIKDRGSADEVVYSAKYAPKEGKYSYSNNMPNYPYQVGDRVLDFHKGNSTLTANKGWDIGKYYGTMFSAKASTTAVENGTITDGEFYLDNLRSYWIDELKMGEVKNAENNVIGQAIEIPFNSKIQEKVTEKGFQSKVWTLKDMFSLVDSNNEVVEEGIEAVTLSEDKKTVKVVLSDNVLGGNDYKILIDVIFCDVYGQGITDYNLPTEISVHTAEKYEATEKPDEITGLLANDTRTFDIKVSTASEVLSAKLGDLDVKTTVLDEGKTIKVSFAEISNPVDGNLVINLKAVDGQTLTITIPVTINSGLEREMLINDDISGLTLGTNLLEGATGTTYYNGKFALTVSKAKGAVIAFGTEGNNDKVEVATDPANQGQGNVLKITNATSGNNLAVNRLYDENKTAYKPRGKVLVIESKYYLPEGKFGTGNTVNYNGLANDTKDGVSNYQRIVDSWGANSIYVAQGNWNTFPGGDTGIDGIFSRAEGKHNLPANQWITVTSVFDMTETATDLRPDTFRTYIDGEPLPATLRGTNAPTTPVYDLFPEGYFGDYPVTGTIAHKEKTSLGTKSYSNLYGIIARTNIPVDGAAYTYYVDDFKAYVVDDFKAEVSGDTSNYAPNKTIKVIFNNKVAENQISKLYVKDAEGNKVEDAVITYANGGMAVDVKLPAHVSKDEVYTFVAPTTFYDVTYQPLKNNADWTFDIKVGEYVAFKGEADKTLISNFATGRDAKATVTFTKPLASTAGIKVLDKDSNEVKSGWTASLSGDLKTVVLNFSDLATGDYTVKFNDVKAEDGDDLLDADNIEIKILAKAGKILLLEENFDGTGDKAYATDKNWFEAANLPAGFKVDAVEYGGGKNPNVTVDGDSVTVTSSYPSTATNLSGNALKVYAPNSKEHTIRVKANHNLGAVNIEADYPNKVIVYEADVFVVNSEDGNGQDCSRILAPSFDDTMKMPTFHKRNTNALKFEGTWLSTPVTTSKADTLRHRWTKSISLSNNTGKKVQMVVDQRSNMDTIKMVVGGTQLTETNHTLLVDHPNFKKTFYEFPMAANSTDDNAFKENNMGDFRGFFMVAKSKTSKAGEVYYDNLKAYLVDAFEITSIEGATEAFNPAKHTITINFTNKVESLENAKANIKLYNAAGVEAESSDYEISLADGGYQVVIDLRDNLPGGSEYKVVVEPLIKDEYGITLASKYVWYDYNESVCEGWAVVSGTALKGLYATEAEAIANQGEFEVKKYTWTMADSATGKVNNFTIDATTATNPKTFIASGYIRNDKAMNLEAVVKLTKSTSLYAEADPALVTGKNIKTSITLTNPESRETDVWIVVAAYGDQREMLGSYNKAMKLSPGQVVTESISFDAKNENIKYVKMFIWDGKATMMPYQNPENIYNN